MASVPCDLTALFRPEQREGAIHTEEMVYELNPLGESPPAISVLRGCWVAGHVDIRTELQLPPYPQTTEAGPWKFLATRTPILFLMEISAPLLGSQVGVSSSPSPVASHPQIHVKPADPV